jgi:hypothetical protein
LLKALLAAKEVEVYIQENNDYRRMGKVEYNLATFLNEEIYEPFIRLFGNLLKIIIKDKSHTNSLAAEALIWR